MHNENFRIKRATLEYEAIAFKTVWVYRWFLDTGWE